MKKAFCKAAKLMLKLEKVHNFYYFCIALTNKLDNDNYEKS